MEAIHYYNGQYLKKDEINISPDDVGFLRGYGVFDFFRVEQGVPVFVEDHLNRLFASAEGFNIQMPLTKDEIKEIMAHLIETNKIPQSSLKIFTTGGITSDGFSPSQPTVLILHQSFTAPDELVYRKGASLMLHNYHRDSPGVKSLQYAQALALQKTWLNEGHIDVLYHDGDLISEVSRSSVFLFKDGVLRTNQKDVLKGITQTNVLRAAEGFFPIEIGDIKLHELLDADEVFISSTTKRILPIVKVGESLIGDGQVGKLSNKLMEIFATYIKAYIIRHQ